MVNEAKGYGMQRSKYSRHSLLAAATILGLAAGAVVSGPPVTLRSAGEGNNRRPTQPKRDTALQREIADHNAAVEARQAAKRDRRRGRG